ncbi:MAG: glycerophosphodiester phosphodiesterase family protein [Planctomycetota bacterium]
MSLKTELGTLRAIAIDCRDRWRSLFAFGLVWRLASVFLLGPAFALVLRLAVAGSGSPVLADTDLLYFATSPIGLLGLVVIATSSLVIVAIETSLYLHLLSQPANDQIIAKAIHQVARHATSLLRIATRVVLHALGWLAPAAAVAAVTYGTLLTKFDINFYLTERPSEFWIAGGVGLSVIAYAAFVILRLATQWILALPIGLFEDETPAKALAESHERCAGNRRAVCGWLLVWLLVSTAISTIATAAVSSTAWLVGPLWPSSLPAVAIGVGLLLLSVAIVGLLTNLASIAIFAAVVWQLYQRLGGEWMVATSDEPTSITTPWLTTSRLAATLGVGGLLAAVIGYAMLASVPLEDDVIVIGHRGSPLAAPENSLSSVRAAIADGADWIEIDVQETADGEVIVFHDSDFMKAAGVDRKVWNTKTEELSEIDIGSRFGADFANEHVPTLEQVLTVCRGKVGVIVELKFYGHDEDLAQRVAEIVERTGTADQTMFMSLNAGQVTAMKSLRPDWPIGRLLSVAVGNKRKVEADFLAINAKAASRSLIRSSHKEDRQVYVWTVNDPVAMSSLISRGVDGLITDVPSVARRVLRERADMPLIARLLVQVGDRFRLAGDALASITTSGGGKQR